jgi:hypothetical protein
LDANLAKRVIQRAARHWRDLNERIDRCEQRIAQHVRDVDVKGACQLMGIELLTASALVATVDEFRQFENTPQFGAWCGISPRHFSVKPGALSPTTPERPCSKAVSRQAVCSSFTPFTVARSFSNLRQPAPSSSTTSTEFNLKGWEVPPSGQSSIFPRLH